MSPAAAAASADPGLDDAFQAAVLFAVDPLHTGLLVRGAPGPARDALLAHLRGLLDPAPVQQDPSPVRPEPWLRMPLGIADDRLLGGLDLPATLRSGTPVLARGLLADADGRVLMVPMIERLSAERTGRLAAVLDAGAVLLEREGIARRLPARLALLGLDEGVDDECCPAALADRMALHVRAEAVVPLVDDRLQVTRAPGPGAAAIAAARERLPAVTSTLQQLEVLCATGEALGVRSVRALHGALHVARIGAALAGREAVADEDLALAARLVLAPRATRVPAPPPEEDPQDAAEAPPPEPPEPRDEADAAPPPESPDDAQQALPDEQTELLIEATLAAVPPDLLAALSSAMAPAAGASRAGRSGAPTRAGGRGRPVGVRLGAPRPGERLALVETLRAAAPWQPLRGAAPGRARIRVQSDDFRVVRYRQRTPTVTLFLVDASGSAAAQRLGETKGAVERLLADCYVRRDEVGVIAFRGTGAEVLLPPTRSLVRARRSLSALPGGGGTPLAAGLVATLRMVEDCRRRGASPVLVVLTDGRANIALDGRADRPQARVDALAAARSLARTGVAAVVIDTSARPDPSARAVADALSAAYRPLPFADGEAMSKVVGRVQQQAAP